MTVARLKPAVLLAIAFALAAAYLFISLQIAFWLWIEPLFCDTAEELCEPRGWDAPRVLRWVAWGLLGMAIAFAFRRAWKRSKASGDPFALLACGLGVTIGLGFGVLMWGRVP